MERSDYPTSIWPEEDIKMYIAKFLWLKDNVVEDLMDCYERRHTKVEYWKLWREGMLDDEFLFAATLPKMKMFVEPFLGKIPLERKIFKCPCSREGRRFLEKPKNGGFNCSKWLVVKKYSQPRECKLEYSSYE